jgi:NADP-dependent aldehyde dehydrogenase
LGVGQFCTNPGLIVLQRSPAAEQFVKDMAARLAATLEGVMLTPGIRKSFVANTATRAQQPGVKVIAQGNAVSLCSAAPVWFETGAREFLGNHALSEEIFGPSSLVVWCKDRAEMLNVAAHIEGSLTATLQAGAAEVKDQSDLIDLLATKAGRLVLNGYPTGVEVSHAMVHGGPYPSTSDGGRSTSVGTRALARWVRPICYQSFTDGLLPPELQNANPLGLLRLVNGEQTKAPVSL